MGPQQHEILGLLFWKWRWPIKAGSVN